MIIAAIIIGIFSVNNAPSVVAEPNNQSDDTIEIVDYITTDENGTEYVCGIPREFVSTQTINPIITNGTQSFVFDRNLKYKDIPYDYEEDIDILVLQPKTTQIVIKYGIGGIPQEMCVRAKNYTNTNKAIKECNVVDLRFYAGWQWDVFGINFAMTPDEVKSILGEPYNEIIAEDPVFEESHSLIYYLEHNDCLYYICVTYGDGKMFDIVVNLNNEPITSQAE